MIVCKQTWCFASNSRRKERNAKALLPLSICDSITPHSGTPTRRQKDAFKHSLPGVVKAPLDPDIDFVQT